MTEIPEDVMNRAMQVLNMLADAAGAEAKLEIIQSAILAEREAQRERDAKIAEGFVQYRGRTVIAAAIRNP